MAQKYKFSQKDLDALYRAEFEDKMIIVVPMLVEKNERITVDELALRFNYLEGFYQKFGMTREQAKNDFTSKLRHWLLQDGIIVFARAHIIDLDEEKPR